MNTLAGLVVITIVKEQDSQMKPRSHNLYTRSKGEETNFLAFTN